MKIYIQKNNIQNGLVKGYIQMEEHILNQLINLTLLLNDKNGQQKPVKRQRIYAPICKSPDSAYMYIYYVYNLAVLHRILARDLDICFGGWRDTESQE